MADTGVIPPRQEQRAAPLFVDCTNGVNSQMRGLAEQSMDDFMRRVERFPTVLMALRLLDYSVDHDRDLKKLKNETRPYATDWLNLLGDILWERREGAGFIHRELDRKCMELSERLQDDYPESAEALNNDSIQVNPIWRLADTLTSLQGRSHNKITNLIDSALMTSHPNGLALKRSVMRKESLGSRARKREVRSIAFTDSTLDYLVHCQVLRNGNKSGYRPLSFGNFLDGLYERYGFCVDRAPAGMTISNDLLQQNRLVLERRLRELGLLVGVNDAETMKLLKPRFQRSEEEEHGAN